MECKLDFGNNSFYLHAPARPHADGFHELLMGEERVANADAIAAWVKSHCESAAAAKAQRQAQRPASGKL